MMKPSPLMVLVAAGAAAMCGSPLEGQSDSVTITPGAQYEAANGLHESLLGRRYRDLWTTPIRVPVLDLATFAGGVTPVSTGGHQQTRSLRLENKEGREFNFRSVDKELTPAMPDFAKETFADWIRQDQTSAQLPAGPVVATALLDAVGVLNPGPQLVVMPDDPRLGEFREEFAGLLGTLEVHPDEGPDDSGFFHDAVVVAGTDRLFEHLREDLDDRVDSREFLKARLMDVFMGDWDRHERQWRWARYDRGELRWWVPVPEDRDYAFVHYDGLLLELTRRLGIIRMVKFGEEYSDLLAMVDNSLEVTQHLLGDLPYEAWDSTAQYLARTLTDQVIRDAVERMPPPHYELVGEELIGMLQSRRDALPGVAREFFLLLNEAAEVHGTEQGDELTVQRHPDGGLEVVLLVGGDPDFPPRFSRTFRPDETEEVRVYLYEGDDEIEIGGAGSDITLRIIGGEGDDELVDRGTGPTAFYDSSGDNTVVPGAGTSIHRRPSIDPVIAPVVDDDGGIDESDEEEEEAQAESAAETEEAAGGQSLEGPPQLIPRLPRDWGESFSPFSFTVDWRGPAELVVGGGPTFTTYGFRHRPYSARYSLAALYAPLHTRFEIQGSADFRRESSLSSLRFTGVASQMAATLFRGFGNDTPLLTSDDARVWHDRLRLEASLLQPHGSRWSTRLGALVDYTDPEPDPGTPAAALPFAQTEGIGRVGAVAGVTVDGRDDAIFPRSGFRFDVTGTGYPPFWDLDDPYGRADFLGAAYLPIDLGLNAVLAARAGGSAAFGEYPFYDAAFIGGSRSLRGFGFQRFAGDQSAFGSAELRVPVTEAKILVRGTLGVSAFGDAGRVYFDGDSSGGWHTALGGSLWFALPVGIANFSYAHGEEDRLYLHLGLPY
jgi:Omp85 superfamily domain